MSATSHLADRALGRATETVTTSPAASVVVPGGMEAVARALPTTGRAVHAAAGGQAGRRAVPDGNRSVILPDVTAEIGGQTLFLSVKGAGAVTPPYGESALDALGRGTGPRAFMGEAWLGEAPYGGQGEINAAMACEVTTLSGGTDCLHGFHFCPVVAIAELPDELTAPARGRFWYRTWRGRYLQEQRLVPSDVRLYHASPRALGQAPDTVLHAFGVRDAAALDAFTLRYAATGMAALTLFARTLREVPWGLHGLDYANVWLDKDSLLAPDGGLWFADLEGLDWVLAGQDWSFEERVREQLEHNAYEVLYGLDVLLRTGERWTERPRSQRERRRAAAVRLGMALQDDAFARPEMRDDGLDVVVASPLQPRETVRIRMVDTD
jgi:hypothetical protein